jgi:hypothetical protein
MVPAFIRVIAAVMAEVVLVTDVKTADAFWSILEEGWRKMRVESTAIGVAYMTEPERWHKTLAERNRR